MADIEGISTDTLIHLYKVMLTIRQVEEKIAQNYPLDEMKTPVHLCIGQEAVSAGICNALDKEDYVLSNHRGHGHYIAKGGNLRKMIAELYNRQGGCSHGRGGSMHLIDLSTGLLGSSSIVAGGVPIAVGAAFASKLSKNGRVAVAFFGDAAVEEGVVYESFNFAALNKVPVIFVCENNLYSVATPLEHRQPPLEIFKRAEIFMPTYSLDGNNVMEVYRVACEVVERARNGNGPSFIECLTYRWCHHHNVTSGVEAGYRPQKELDFWIEKCPLKNFKRFLKQKNLLTEDVATTINKQIEQDILEAFEYALSCSSPAPETLFDGLYF